MAEIVGTLSLLPPPADAIIPFMDEIRPGNTQEIEGRPKRIVLLIVEGFQLLDLAGPLDVFSGANAWAAAEGGEAPPYAVEVVAPRRGLVASSAGLQVQAAGMAGRGDARGAVDTLIVIGGRGTSRARRNQRIVGWIRKTAASARRVASVCNGAFLLGEAGLLEGRGSTTHWALCGKLEKDFPGTRVSPDSIFVRDGKVWTSAGVSAGMDLALALVEEDLGRRAALTIARWMVLFLKRPGGQTQFSAQLALQAAESEPLRELQHWMAKHLAADLSVAALARKISMSPRNFARVFKKALGQSPGKYVERLRLEAARRSLEDTCQGVKTVAVRCGFGTEETLRRVFQRQLGVSPSEFRSRFRTDAPQPGHRPKPDTILDPGPARIPSTPVQGHEETL